ncbi:hypothetical protein DP18_2744 [Staphylococcus aureus]|nr:hypothetical protein DP18_2744 [Staphylococcus aureus]
MPKSHHSFNGSSTSSYKVPIPNSTHVVPHLQSLIVPMRTPRFILAMRLNLVHKLFNISQCFNHRWWSWHMSFCHLIKCFMRGTF